MPLVEDKEFDALLADRRYNELKDTLGEIATSLNKKDNKDVVDAVNSLTKVAEGFTEALKNLPQPEKPEVKVEVNQQDVVSSVSDMGSTILQGLEAVKTILEKPEEKKEWEFKVKRDFNNLITSITAIQK